MVAGGPLTLQISHKKELKETNPNTGLRRPMQTPEGTWQDNTYPLSLISECVYPT